MIFALQIAAYFIGCVICASYTSLLERKLIARIQHRVGPDHCGVYGVVQPLADALKLFFKRSPFAGHSKQEILGVILMLAASLCQLALVPDTAYGLPLIILCHSVMVFAEVLIGTSSRSKFGVIGGTRAYFQLLGGHIPLMLGITAVILLAHSLNPADFCPDWIDIPLLFAFFTTLLMTGHRLPFDFPEAESELVGGSYVECGGILFAMIYLSDYLNLLFISALTATLCGARHVFLLAGTFLIVCLIITLRALLTRSTQEQMFRIAWLIIVPIQLVYILGMCAMRWWNVF